MPSELSNATVEKAAGLVAAARERSGLSERDSLALAVEETRAERQGRQVSAPGSERSRDQKVNSPSLSKNGVVSP